MKKSVWLFLVAGALLSALAVAACGGDDNEDTGDNQSPAATTGAAGTRTPAATSPGSAGNDQTPPAGGENTVNVKTQNFAFDPAEITVPAGEPITFNFTNADSVRHTFTLYLDEGYTQAIDGGSASADTPEITVSFVDPGDYFFRCEVHPTQMEGVLTAE